MKRILVFIFACYISSSVFGETVVDRRMKVAIMPFTFADSKDKKYVKEIKERVQASIEHTKRFQIIDMSSEAEREKIKKASLENYNSAWEENSVDFHSAAIAKYYVTAQVGDIKFVRVSSTNPNGYKSTFSITLKLTETESTSVIATTTFEASTKNPHVTPEGSLINAMSDLEGEMSAFIKANFPLHVEIAKVSKQKGGKAQEVLIYGGSYMGMEKGSVFKIESIDRSMGAPLTTDIGKLKVIEVVNEYFSKCSVKKGNEELLSKINDKSEIQCTLIK